MFIKAFFELALFTNRFCILVHFRQVTNYIIMFLGKRIYQQIQF